MKKINKIKKFILVLMVLLVGAILVYGVLFVLPNKDKEKALEENEKIKYEYVLYNRDNNLYKDTFKKLKDILNADIDYSKYAEYISELFIIDLYTLSNKDSKEDVGGLQYVLDSVKDNYKLNVSNTLYRYIGIQKELPEVSSIELKDIKNINYEISGKTYEAYEINLNWEYKKDYGYDKEGTVIVIKDNDKLYVVEKK